MGNQTFAHCSSRGDDAHKGGTSAAPRNAVRRSGPYAVQESATYRRDAPANLSPRVLYVSETLLAVDKPAGIIVHGDGTGTKTLTDLVRRAVERGAIDHVAPTCAAEAQALFDLQAHARCLRCADRRTRCAQALPCRCRGPHTLGSARYSRTDWQGPARCAAHASEPHGERRSHGSDRARPKTHRRSLVHPPRPQAI